MLKDDTLLCLGLGDPIHLKNENQDLLLHTTKSTVLESVSLSTSGKFSFMKERWKATLPRAQEFRDDVN